MEVHGKPPAGLEFGNAWALWDPAQPPTNGLLVQRPPSPSTACAGSASCPVIRQELANRCVKWFQHHPDDPLAWGYNKPLSEGRTLSILIAPGRFHYTFNGSQEPLDLCLEQSGDFVIWGANLTRCWRVLEPSTVLTIRWQSCSTLNE